MESRDELPPGEPPGPLVPAGAAPPGNAAPPLHEAGGISAQERDGRFWTVWPPVLLAWATAVVIILADLVGLAMNGFDFSYPQRLVDWTEANMAGQFVAGLAATALLLAAGSSPRWRRVMALSAWGIFPWQVGWTILTSHLGGTV